VVPDRVDARFRRPLSRLSLLVPVAAILASLLLDAHPCRATLHSGEAHIHWDAVWDFSDFKATVLPDGDLYWVEVTLQPKSTPSSVMYFTSNPPALITFAPPDSTYEQLTSAPADLGSYGESLAALLGYIYVVRTGEGNYVKLHIKAFVGGGITFDYTYQDDGSRVLAPTTATALTTWGKIKSLYR
jgi:hypothetical protein